MSSTPVKALDTWVNDLFTLLFFQPDDQLADKAFDENMSPNVHVDVNGQIIPGPAYKEIVRRFRRVNIGKDLGNPTLAMTIDNAEQQTGVVAQCGRFSGTTRDEGKETRSVAVTICKVELVDGKRVLTRLTEVLAQE